MNASQAVLFLAFANQATRPLHQLSTEETQLRDLLHTRSFDQGHFHVHPESYADLNKLRSYLTKFQDQIWLFHYAGHAASEQLFLTSGSAHAEGVAGMLGAQKHLKLVFLNGCSTQGQVKNLLASGVPAVIATHCPIEDTLAREFAYHFYEALVQGGTIQAAFEGAAQFVQAAHREKPIVRGLEEEDDELVADETWGLFVAPGKEAVLGERLPAGMRTQVPEDYEPNLALIDAIWEALEAEGVVSARRGKTKLSKKRMAILNNLPAPIAEHLRKLFVPLGDADEGYNKISHNRLRQLARTYQVLMELLVFTLLAQIWEQQVRHTPIALTDDLRKTIHDFLHLPQAQRDTFAFIPFIRQLRQALDEAEVEYFVEELSQLAELVAQQTDFQQACRHYDLLRHRLKQENDTQLQEEIGSLCVEAETQLTHLFAELGFLGRYTLATVKQIIVQKYRHKTQARFQHIVVRLLDLLGGMEEEEEEFANYLDSQSVLLLKEEEDAETLPFLNLSPFIIDENAFVDNSDVSKIFFLHARQSQAWVYRWVQRPHDPALLVPGESFAVVEEQLNEFVKTFT